MGGVKCGSACVCECVDAKNFKSTFERMREWSTGIFQVLNILVLTIGCGTLQCLINWSL